MKKILSLIISIIVILLATTSCTKTVIQKETVTDTVRVTVTDTLKPAPTIIGFWAGSYKIPGYPDSAYLSFDLRPGDTLLCVGVGFDGNTYYSQGTYTLTGTTFSYTFTGLNGSQAGAMQTGTGTYSPTAGTITNGTLQNVGTSVTGTFSLTKSQ